MPPAAFLVHDIWFDILVSALVLGAMIQGARIGLFRATIAALMAVTAFFVPLAIVNPLARWLTSMDVPRSNAPSLAFLILLVATLALIRRLTSQLIPPRAMRLPPVVDIIGGSGLGAVAGTVIAGTVLVTGSILLAPALRPSQRGIAFDAGEWMLKIFAGCLEADRQARSTLLAGEPPADDRRPPGDPAGLAAPRWQHAGTCAASEPFVDANCNGARDDGEPFFDIDGNMAFGLRLLFTDNDADGRRDIGLLERYRLGSWHLVTQLADDDDDAAGADPPVGDAR